MKFPGFLRLWVFMSRMHYTITELSLFTGKAYMKNSSYYPALWMWVFILANYSPWEMRWENLGLFLIGKVSFLSSCLILFHVILHTLISGLCLSKQSAWRTSFVVPLQNSLLSRLQKQRDAAPEVKVAFSCLQIGRVCFLQKQGWTDL